MASEAYHDWSGEAAGARLRVNFTLKLLHAESELLQPALMRFIRSASNIGPAAAVPAGPTPAPLHMVAARLGFEKAMVGTEWATFCPDCMDRLRKH